MVRWNAAPVRHAARWRQHDEAMGLQRPVAPRPQLRVSIRDPTMAAPAAVTIVGAGLAGTLVSILLARRGHRVCVYERLPDLRREPVAAGRSINLALAARGMRALAMAEVMANVQPLLIPMPGRMLHDLDGEQTFIRYGQRPEEVIYSVSRPALNGVLLEAAEAAGVQFRFKQSVAAAQFAARRLLMRDVNNAADYVLPMQRVIAADGAGSTLRRSLAAELGVACSEDLLAHGYKELTLAAGPDGQHRLDPNALHIWPRGGFMLIALPNTDGSFTGTLFLQHQGEPSFASLGSPASVQVFFAHFFSDACALMPTLSQDFFAHPVGTMGTVRCLRWSAGDDLLLIGDAAHAITPFHGQGMNCAFEDCRVLDELLHGQRDQSGWSDTFAGFERVRRPDTDAIATMAVENYLEMRDTVRSPDFQLRKLLSLELERRFPDRFVPRYSMVMFHSEIPYSQAYSRGQIQQGILEDLTRNAASLTDIDYPRAATLITQQLPPLR